MEHKGSGLHTRFARRTFVYGDCRFDAIVQYQLCGECNVIRQKIEIKEGT